jgi:hypothetical protein
MNLGEARRLEHEFLAVPDWGSQWDPLKLGGQ